MSMWDRAVERLTLEPVFGSKAWTPASTCGDVHPHGSIPAGSRCCCMSCHGTGVDHHPSLRETAADKLRLMNWKPPEGGDQWSDEDTAEPTVYQPEPPRVPTRRERRARARREVAPTK